VPEFGWQHFLIRWGLVVCGERSTASVLSFALLFQRKKKKKEKVNVNLLDAWLRQRTILCTWRLKRAMKDK
jgi:hypothetical protein